MLARTDWAAEVYVAEELVGVFGFRFIRLVPREAYAWFVAAPALAARHVRALRWGLRRYATCPLWAEARDPAHAKFLSAIGFRYAGGACWWRY